MHFKFVVTTFAIAASFSAYGQSSLSLYGQVDANVGAVTNTVGGTKILEQSGAFAADRWGFRGVEELGDGLRAVVRLESSFLLQNGALSSAGTLWGKLSYLSIESDAYGSVTLGRQFSPMFIMMAYFTPGFYSNQYNPVLAVVGTNFVENNSVKYSFKRGGLEAQVLYSFGGKPGSLRQNSALGGGVSYKFGLVSGLISFDQTNTASNFNYAPDRRAALALSADLGKLKIMGGYRYGNGETYLAPTYQYYHRDDLFWLGGTYYVTPSNSIIAEYWLDDIKSYGVNAAAHTSLPKAQQFDFQFRHFLSKSTDLYVVGAYARQAAIDFDNLYSGSTTALESGRHDQIGFGVGMFHRF